MTPSLPVTSHRQANLRRVMLSAALVCAALGAACNEPLDNPIKPEVVTSPVILSINVLGEQIDPVTLQLSAFAQFSDGSVQDVTTQVAWTSSNGSVATVDAAGLVQAVGNGSAEIRATLEGIVGTFPLNVAGL